MIPIEYKDINAMNLKLMDYNYNGIVAMENRLIDKIMSDSRDAVISTSVSGLCIAILVGIIFVIFMRRRGK